MQNPAHGPSLPQGTCSSEQLQRATSAEWEQPMEVMGGGLGLCSVNLSLPNHECAQPLHCQPMRRADLPEPAVQLHLPRERGPGS